MCFWYVFLVFTTVFIFKLRLLHQLIGNILKATVSLLQITTIMLPYLIIYLFFSVYYKSTADFNYLDHISTCGK